MARVLLAGGGTGGHVYPLLATAAALRAHGHEVLALGTAGGLEAQLVPQSDVRLLEIPKLPFPRRLGVIAIRFPAAFLRLRKVVENYILQERVDLVIGFGGYVAAPAYAAAARLNLPYVVHEANILPGLASRLGSRRAAAVACAFPGTKLRAVKVVGMPIRAEFTESVGMDPAQARIELGLDPLTPTLLVTGGSLGALKINAGILGSLDLIRAAGVQVFHVTGRTANLAPVSEPGYIRVEYLSRMDVAMAAASLAISRAGASTVSELLLFGVPSILVPYAVGNGEQRLNAQYAVSIGAAELCLDHEFNPAFVAEQVIPLVSSPKRLSEMAEAARAHCIPDAAERLVALALAQLDTGS